MKGLSSSVESITSYDLKEYFRSSEMHNDYILYEHKYAEIKRYIYINIKIYIKFCFKLNKVYTDKQYDRGTTKVLK